ncbi:MAG: hypothetical protein ABI792_08685 [bacterium]
MTTTNKPDWKLALGIPFGIFISCFLITLSSKFKSNQQLLSEAIIIDLLITAPLVYYFAIRNSSVSKFTILRVFLAGVIIAGWMLNSHTNTLLDIIKTWVAPLVEGVIIIFIVGKFYSANKKAKQSEKNNICFLNYCRSVLKEITGSEKAGNIIASEIAVFYYAFLGRKEKNIDNKSKFTSYKENGILLFLGTFLSLFIIEITGVHFILILWNSTIAWIITLLSLYTCLQLFAHIRAIKARPITFNSNNSTLEIYNGLAGDVVINYDNIESVESSSKIPMNRKYIILALLRKLEKHNCIIYLKEPVKVIRIFGIVKSTDTVLFYVDGVKYFTEILNLQLNRNVG